MVSLEPKVKWASKETEVIMVLLEVVVKMGQRDQRVNQDL